MGEWTHRINNLGELLGLKKNGEDDEVTIFNLEIYVLYTYTHVSAVSKCSSAVTDITNQSEY